MSTYGSRVYVYSEEEFERLMAHPSSLSGEWRPETSMGEVVFPTQTIAMEIHRKGERA